MFKPDQYVSLFESTEYGAASGFAIKILVAATNMPDLKAGSTQEITYRAADNIGAEIKAAIMAADPDKQTQARMQRAELVALFDNPDEVEEIPNGYCNQWCCRHLPWFVVTTPVGKIKLGWRKRVISIDWTSTLVEATAEELFPNEKVTKSLRLIHAWGIDDARRYIQTILTSGR